MVRGIENVSGVSCHISCALQIIYHVLKPLREVLKEENNWSEKGILSEFHHFFKALASGDKTEQQTTKSTTTTNNGTTTTTITDPVNPSLLYRILAKETSLEQDNVGDSSTAIAKVLKVIRNQGSDWDTLLDRCVGGETVQVICGRKTQETEGGEGYVTLVRTKRGKSKPLACPFPLAGKDIDSAIQMSFDHPIIVSGYNWDNANPNGYEEQQVAVTKERKDSSYEVTAKWETTKSVVLERPPMFLFLHLERFTYANDTKVLSNAHINIPLSISIGKAEEKDEAVLNLRGGILHVSEDSIEEEGHYVSIVCCDGDDQWFLLDDDIARPLNMDHAVQLLEGHTDSGKFYCATLLAYEDDDYISNKDISNLVDKLKTKMLVQDEASTLEDPSLLVGRRLSVRWSKGKFYPGVVESYDPVNGKHRVKYDDGDIRDYLLKKKTIEWL